MKRPILFYRQAQAAHDLIQLIQSYNDTQLTALGGDKCIQVVRANNCRFEDDDQESCYTAVATRAIEAGDSAALAVALLVSNELQNGRWTGDTVEFSEFASDQIESAHQFLKSAILRGLDALPIPYSSVQQPTPLLPNISRLSRPASQIEPKLCAIARSMDKYTRESVSKVDHGWQSEEHLRALNEVLAREDCRFKQDEYWCPSEVVELVAHVRSTPGFVSCTALLLTNALPTKDRQGWFGFRWGGLSLEYNQLPDSSRPVILAGIRYLYECSTELISHWFEGPFDPNQSLSHLIPYTELPDDDLFENLSERTHRKFPLRQIPSIGN